MAFQRVASIADVPDGRVQVVEVGDIEVAVCNVGGSFCAIDNVCSHDGGPLNQGELDGQQIECPRHGARFDVCSGRALTLPAVRGVRTFPVEVRDGSVYVDLAE